jgi:hypothetical protein
VRYAILAQTIKVGERERERGEGERGEKKNTNYPYSNFKVVQQNLAVMFLPAQPQIAL